MPLSLTIRSATAEDESAVVALWQACDLVTSYNDPGKDFRFARAKKNSDILVGADATATIIGSVMVGHEGHRGWVYYVAAHPDHRKQGIGRQMIQAAETRLSDQGIPKLMLLVRDTDTQVVDFYRQLGFQTAPRIVMEKWLTRSSLLPLCDF